MIAQQTVYQGTINSSAVRPAEVFRPAVTRACLSIIVVHNHPSGDPTPSPEDIRTTEQLRKAGEYLDIQVLDHIIIGRHNFVSLKEQGPRLLKNRYATLLGSLSALTLIHSVWVAAASQRQYAFQPCDDRASGLFSLQAQV